MLQPTQDQDKYTATCPYVSSPPSRCCDVSSPPSRCCDVSFPPSRCCDVSSQPSGCCCVFFLRHRMMQCVLSRAQAAAQAVIVQKVDQHVTPPPEGDVHAVEEAPHHQPPYTVQVFPSLPGGDDVCDGQVVTDEQGGLVVSVFLLSHIRIFILRRFFPQLLLSSLSHLGKPPPPTPSQDQYIPCPTNLLHIPQPPLSMVRVRNTSVWSLYPHPGSACSPGRAVQWWSVNQRCLSVGEQGKYWGERVGAVKKYHQNY
jgi:hypothetical protein